MHSVSVLSKKKKKKKKNEFKNSLPVASIELLLTGARTTLTFSDAADYGLIGLIETSGDLGVGIENRPSFSSSSFFFKGLTRLRARATEREREREKQK